MPRDPFYRQIIAGLEAELDPNQFEACAADLLRSDYPTLVPIRGGSDSGMDGAIADGDGEPFPLITTTGKNVTGNLKRNLEKYVEDGGKRRKAVLATSQHLTPRRQVNLRSEASKRGFTLIQIHDQDDFANRLYRNPQWCWDLLGLTGDPPALSILPKTARLLITIPMIGREADLSWLCDTEGDRLLVGQPGSGKTFLLYNLAKTGAALFAVSSEIGPIAQAYRAEQPDIIIVDDAHLPQHQELVQNLKYLRDEIGATFSIVASCWPGQQSTIAGLLNLPAPKVHMLELLGRDEILQIVQAAGISGERAPFYQPLNLLIHEIIDQAEGRPGLAVTLTHLFLQGDWQHIVSGDALAQSVLNVFLPSSDRNTKQVMAGFAVGGEAGMPMEVVADTLSMAPVTVQNIIVELESGGIVIEFDGNIAVRPAALRFALIREVFCSGTALALPERILHALISQAPYLPDVVRTLIGSAGRGAVVPPGLFTMLLEQIDSQGTIWRPTLTGYLRQDDHSDVWRMYAWLGPDETQWILENCPEKLTEIAWPALENAPEVALPMLLQAAIDDNRMLNANPDHPLRQIQDWIVAGHPGTAEALKRRGALFSVIEDWILSGNDVSIGLKGLHYAFSPRFHITTSDPGSGNALHLRHGLLLPEEIRALHSEWPRARKLLEKADLQNWQSLRELAEEWAYTGWLNEVRDEIRQAMREFAVELLADVLAVAVNRPGVLHWARDTANNIRADIEIPLAPDFDVLYPVRKRDEDWRGAEQHEVVKARELAARWSNLEPAPVIPKMVSMAQEAQLSGTTWPEYLTFVCREIAERVDCALEWLSIMVDSPLGSALLQPFFTQAVRRNEAGWMELAHLMIEMPQRQAIVISEILKKPDAPSDMLEHIMGHMGGMAQHVEFLCFRNEIPESTLRLLYQHSDPSIAGIAAVGSWHAEPKGAIPATLYTAWRTAIINWDSDDYHLGEVLKSDSQLAEDWISARLSETEFHVYQHGKLRDLVARLDQDARLRLLEQIPDRYGLDGLVSELIDRQPELYQTLLNMNHLEQYHLAPLEGIPDEPWAELARLALAAGYERGRVAAATLGFGPSWSGKESEMWMTWIVHWERLCSHHDPAICAVAQQGKAYAEGRYRQAREEEKIEAIYGRI